MSSIVVNQDSEKDAWTILMDKEYSIQIEALGSGYSGAFVEDGSNEKVSDVLALRFTNNGKQVIQYAEYVFGIDNETVSFKLTDLLP